MKNYNGYTIYVTDTETTGIDCNRNEIIEISMARINLDTDLNSTYDQKTWYLKCSNPDSIDEEALRVNGYKKEDILGLTKFGKEMFKEPTDVVAQIESWIMEDDVSSIDRIFSGHNPNFDLGFMTKLWEKVGSPDTFPFEVSRGNRILDTKQIMIMVDICTGRRRLNYNLLSLVKALSVKKGKAHKAEEDVRMTCDVLLSLIKPLQKVAVESFKDSYID